MSEGSRREELFGPYLVYEQLGVGGMAAVHRAEMPGIEGFSRPVALKRMLPHVANNPELVQSFVKEARLASHLRHTNVPQTYELGMVDGIYFMAMELVEGYTLREILQHCAQTTGPMPVPIALAILNQLCDALDYAHNCTDDSGTPLGIIHRDVSPSNVIISQDGCVKLIDFGIAKAADDSMQTVSGTIKGKFGYMAPEYILGHLDARADLFALGVIAHELLTNRPLFTGGDDMQTLQRVQNMPIVPPSQSNPAVPADIDDIIMTALARDPERRWQQASALRQAMTTLTKRLDMVVPNQKIIEWIEFAFEHTRPSLLAAPLVDTGGSISMLIEPPSSDSATTTITNGFAPRSTPRAAVPSTEQLPVGYLDRREEIVPSDSMIIDELLPTQVRGSAPKVSPGPVTMRGSAAAIRLPPASSIPPRPASIPPENGIPQTSPGPAPMPSRPPSVERPPAPAKQLLAPPAKTVPPPDEGRPVLAVLFVLILAGAVAVGVYLLLPLIT